MATLTAGKNYTAPISYVDEDGAASAPLTGITAEFDAGAAVVTLDGRWLNLSPVTEGLGHSLTISGKNDAGELVTLQVEIDVEAGTTAKPTKTIVLGDFVEGTTTV